MLVVIQFPMIDSRRYLYVPTHKLKKPVWTLPEVGKEFVRSFGGVKKRIKGGLKDLIGENQYCSSSNAIIFPPLLHKKGIGDKNHTFFPACVFRRFFYDGEATARVEIGFCDENIDDFNIDENTPPMKLTSIIKDILKIQVKIPKWSDKDVICELQDAGRELARHYLESTTKIINKKLEKTEKWWVKDGNPMIYVVLNSHVKLKSMGKNNPIYFDHLHDGLKLSHMYYYRKEKPIGIWILRKMPNVDEDYIRRLRLYLFRLNAERESFKHIVRHMRLELMNIESKSQESDKLQKFLFNITSLLLKKSRFGIEQSDFLKNLIDIDRVVNEEELAILMDYLENINVRRAVKERFIDYICTTQPEISSIRKQKSVFISYNHNDIKFVKKLKKKLEEAKIPCKIDINTLRFGDDIREFIEKNIEETDYTISIVSENSLKSPWVVEESLLTLTIQKVKKTKKFIPVYIDKSFFKYDAHSKIIEVIEKVIQEIDNETTKLRGKMLSTRNLDDKRDQLIELRHNIDKILKKLRESLACDMSDDKQFEQNLHKLVNLLKEKQN